MIFFKLKKFYYDGIDLSGNAFILYKADLQILGVSIPYSAIIVSEGNQTHEKSVLGSSINDLQTFENEKLNVSGKWQPIDFQLPTQILLNQKGKKITWHCFLPKGKFLLKNQGKSFSGLGYGEVLEMNFAPWKMPISELKWGRYLSENHHIIWIEWIGEQPLKKVFWNGNEVKNAQISDSGISIAEPKIHLKFENPIPIKDEKLLKITDKYPFLKLFFRKKFLQSREMKFKSKSTLTIENQQDTGFSLYETVLWKK